MQWKATASCRQRAEDYLVKLLQTIKAIESDWIKTATINIPDGWHPPQQVSVTLLDAATFFDAGESILSLLIRNGADVSLSSPPRIVIDITDTLKCYRKIKNEFDEMIHKGTPENLNRFIEKYNHNMTFFKQDHVLILASKTADFSDIVKKLFLEDSICANLGFRKYREAILLRALDGHSEIFNVVVDCVSPFVKLYYPGVLHKAIKQAGSVGGMKKLERIIELFTVEALAMKTDGMSPLHSAVMSGSVEAYALIKGKLEDIGNFAAEKDHQGEGGDTALHIAVRGKNPAMIEACS